MTVMPKIKLTDLDLTSNLRQGQPALTEIDLKHHSQELGMLGRFFGSRDNAPTNIASVAVLLFIFLLALASILPLADGVDRDDLIKTVCALLLSSLGYLFGSASGRR